MTSRTSTITAILLLLGQLRHKISLSWKIVNRLMAHQVGGQVSKVALPDGNKIGEGYFYISINHNKLGELMEAFLDLFEECLEN